MPARPPPKKGPPKRRETRQAAQSKKTAKLCILAGKLSKTTQDSAQCQAPGTAAQRTLQPPLQARLPTAAWSPRRRSVCSPWGCWRMAESLGWARGRRGWRLSRTICTALVPSPAVSCDCSLLCRTALCRPQVQPALQTRLLPTGRLLLMLHLPPVCSACRAQNPINLIALLLCLPQCCFCWPSCTTWGCCDP